MFNKKDINRDECQLFGKQAKKATTGGGIHLPRLMKRQAKKDHSSSNSFYVIQNMEQINRYSVS